MNNNGEFGLDRYDFSALENCLAQFFSGGKVLFSESIHSTNEWGMRLPLPETTAETPKAYLLLANRQSAGRGRMGRTWSSPASGDIYMSLVLNGSFPFASAGLLPLAMGLAVQRALQACLEAQVHLKWPNDVICYGKKIGGYSL